MHDQNQLRVTRRSLIAGMAAMPLAHGAATTLSLFADDRGQSPGFIIREREPQNLEADFASLNSLITPNGRFYVRSHFAVPTLNAKSWKLKIEGAVKNELQLTYEELLRLPSETRTVTLECAGNGRVYLVPKVDGAQWQLGAVSTAEWTGVLLSTLIDRVGIDPDAVELVFEGADAGEPSKPSKPAGPINFARSIPVDKARKDEILLAYQMNGQPLPQSHGFPLRAIVPGWYGMASVKWLSRILAVKQPFHGYFQSVDYAYWQHRDGLPTRVPVTAMQVKSQIARPTIGEVIEKGSTYRVFGAAWSGGAPVSKVEISTDGGKNYVAATLLGKPIEHAWRLWEYKWNVPPKADKYLLMAKATDAKGNTQPLERDKDREAYMINHVIPVEIQVR